MRTLTRQKGISLLAAIVIALVAAAAAALLSSWFSANSVAHSNRCTRDMMRMQADEVLYQQSVANSNPDQALCNKINRAIEQYNRTCGEDFGAFTKKDC
jgi:lipopolysaccharide export LptBFGC system permease protein LptF